jgi:beta-mannosidase
MTTYFANIVWGWYQDIFLNLIPSVLSIYDPVRNYWPTSPEYGYGNPLSFKYGDSHYWGVWANSQPIYTYITNVGRFVSEYGMQGMLSWNSLARFSQPSDWNFNSTVMKAHERHLNGWPLLTLYMQNYQPITNFLNFAYATQVMQKYALQIAIEAHRRNKPITMGTLTWQLNDLWPVFSWSTRDYYGTWKAPMYMQKKMYNDVVVSIIQNQTKTKQYDVYVISDKIFAFNATLNITVMTLSGQNLLVNS